MSRSRTGLSGLQHSVATMFSRPDNPVRLVLRRTALSGSSSDGQPCPAYREADFSKRNDTMRGRPWHSLLWPMTVFASFWACAAIAQERPRIGYVFPAGGRQGTTFLVTVGGQFLGSWKGEYQIDVLQCTSPGAASRPP